VAKQIYKWSSVRAGDIISFRYKGNKPTATLTTILVLNPKMPYKGKQGNVFHLIGLKLESQGNIPFIRNRTELVELLDRIGNLQVVDVENEIYRVEIQGTGPRGLRKAAYTKLKRYFEQHGNYRTYRWEEATNSTVFLEPIKLPQRFREILSA
tara:strand:+ start:235 stop:693 length:459 start_codon:yes stop_codon:yes gene_type:complete